MEQVVTAEEAAKLRDVSGETIRRWCRKGWLKSGRKAGKTWLISKSEVLDFKQPRRGPRPKCPNCGSVLTADHECESQE